MVNVGSHIVEPCPVFLDKGEREKRRFLIILFLLGFLCLIKGGDWFVDGAVGLAQRFRVPDLLIGTTVVSIGTTLPEVMVSTTSALTGHGEIAYGNAIGSVICNTALIAAITIAVRPEKTDRKALGLPLLFFFGAAAVYAVTAYTTGYFSRSIALLLLAMFVVYIIISVIQAKQAPQSGHSQQSGELMPVPQTLILLVVGAALIAVGAKLLVDVPFTQELRKPHPAPAGYIFFW